MKSHLHITIITTLAALCLCNEAAKAQTISEIAKSDPLIITGSVGTRNTYFHSSAGNSYASPLSNMFYLNLNVSLYGFNMPFSFYYSNNNLDFNYPHINFKINPQYKNWRGYIGRTSLNFSPYIMNMSFNGVGLEYRGRQFHTSIFYGTFRNAINDDPDDPAPRNPQYQRVGWGFNVGYSNGRGAIDLYMLRAYDRLNTIDASWRERIAPQENLSFGLKGSYSFKRYFSFATNLAMSAFSTDRRADKIETDETKRFDKIFDTRYTSLARFAGDVSLNFNTQTFNTSVFYRMVQPDYLTLGTNYLANNYHSIGVTMGTYLFRNISLSATFSGQEDNLTNRQMYTTRGYVYSANASSRIGEHFNVSGSYSGYLTTQGDGTEKVNDTTQVKRIMHSLAFTPTYTTENEILAHTASLSASWSKNKDLNKFSTGVGDYTSLALGATYDLGVKAWDMDFITSLSHQNTKGSGTRYTSDVASLTTSRSFLSEKNLNLSATLSLCYNEVEKMSKSLSMGMDFSASYTINNEHMFSFTAGMYKYGDVNPSKTHDDLDATDISLSFNYNYTFTLLELKKKAEKASKKK